MKMAFGPMRKTRQLDLALAVVTTTITFAGGYAQAFPPEDPPCPTSALTSPQGGTLAPRPLLCSKSNGTCLVTFGGYQWWTSYQFPFFNNGLRTPFAPDHAFIGNDGNLHLVANNDVNLGGGFVWSGAEAVLMFNKDGTKEANLGYGDYLVTAKLVDHFWADLDPNMAFGVFTYENPKTPGSAENPNREIDLAEISRWGWNHIGNIDNCPIGGVDGFFPNKTLCHGNAQFALQLIGNADKDKGPLMVDRYNIGDSTEVTLVMRWHERDVKFEKYTGAHSLDNLPGAPHDKWQDDLDRHPTPSNFKTDPPKEPPEKDLRNFIPVHTANSCERFHINFWFGNYSAGQNSNPPPSSRQEVIITNFEFRP
jgi:hypothetical protein